MLSLISITSIIEYTVLSKPFVFVIFKNKIQFLDWFNFSLEKVDSSFSKLLIISRRTINIWCAQIAIDNRPPRNFADQIIGLIEILVRNICDNERVCLLYTYCQIMDKVLDKEVHQLYKVDSTSYYLSQIMSHPPPSTLAPSFAVSTSAAVPPKDQSRDTANILAVSLATKANVVPQAAYLPDAAGGVAVTARSSVAPPSSTGRHSKKAPSG